MLVVGRLDAACLPEPMMRAAVAGGARPVLDSRALPFTPGVVLFTDKAVKTKPSAIRAFYRAYNRAVRDIREGRPGLRELLVRKGNFPPGSEDFIMPVFAPARPTGREEYADVTGWMAAKGLLEDVPPYEKVVDGSLLP